MKKSATTLLIIFAFSASMLLLSLQIFPNAFGQIAGSRRLDVQNNSEYEEVAEISLGSVRAIDSRQMGAPAGEVVFSPTNNQFAVGTENGELIVCSAEGKEQWREKLGLGKISLIAFINQGREMLVGEASPDGSLRCLDSRTGKEDWRIDSQPDLGVDLSQKIYPTFLSAVQNKVTGEILAMAQRYEFDTDGTRRYQTRIYRINSEGKVIGRYPQDHNIDVWVGTVNVDEKRNHLIFGAASYYPILNLEYGDNVYCVDIASGAKLWSVKLDVVSPYKTATVRYAPVLSPEQNEMAFLAGDGRVFFCDAQGEPLWGRTISVPRSVGGVYLNATPLDALVKSNRVLFFTSSTYNRVNWQFPTPLEHPGGNSVFLFDRQGMLVAKYTAKGMIGNVVANEDVIGLPVGVNLRTQEYSAHGVVLLNLRDGSERTFLSTIGPCIRVAADAEFHHIVGVEAPMKTDEGAFIGSYKIHVWRQRV